jgi:hypothetical protein
MNIFLFARQTALLALATAVLAAGDTRFWSESEYSDFDKGNLKNLSLRSDGRLTVAPHARELFDTNLPYLWALARDSKGNLYAGGGSGAKLYRISPGSDSPKGKLLAELDGLAVQAIAIDARDRVYAATSPDGKVYRIAANGKPEVFYDPKTKYIWALAFDGGGNLYVATGDSGQIHRVTPEGKGTVWYSSGEAHVRSLAVDRAGNILAGTDPGGLIIRVSPGGNGFVVYQMAKPEVTALAVAPDGAIYAAGVGNKLTSAPPAPVIQPSVATPPATAPGLSPGASPGSVRVAAMPPQSVGPAAGVSGGSEVYRIESDGSPSRVWSNGQEVVYAIAFDSAGHAILGTGNHGRLYRIETPYLYTSLVSFTATQITALTAGPTGGLFAVTGNVGKVEQIGPELEPEGTLESDVFDAGMFTLWGRLSFDGTFNGGHISLTARSGNLDQPERDWSAWSAPIDDSKGARLSSPPARFVQWKARLSGPAELQSVDLAYLPKNQPPRLEEIEITPPNYKFPAGSAAPATSGNPATLNLPPLGRHTASAAPSFSLESSPTSTPALQAAKGMIGARWLSSDPNGDPLIYKVEIRGVKETEWKLLKDKIAEKYFSWDSTAFPDGEYHLRVTASDAPGNPPAEALTASLESDRFLIDNTPPKITNLTGTRGNGNLEIRWHAADALNNITEAEYSLDGGDWTVAEPVTKLSDSLELDYILTLPGAPGEHTIAVRLTDDYDNQAVEKVVVR